mgnify:CR=1 FL=1|tara:strand:- start:708 stop:1550 length:843 start_codon:yes stop_codon:yes gene_type:complete
MESKGEKSMKKTIYAGITFMVIATIFVTSSIALAGENTEPSPLCNNNELECGSKEQSESGLNTQTEQNLIITVNTSNYFHNFPGEGNQVNQIKSSRSLETNIEFDIPSNQLGESVNSAIAEISKQEQLFDSIIVVDPSIQKLFLVRNLEIVGVHGTSTGKKGLSNISGSGGTATGLFHTGEVIEGAVGERVKRWGAQGVLVDASDPADMTTRLITLHGQESKNKNTLSRGVYIHGTNLPSSIGTPDSHGCVRVLENSAIEIAEFVKEAEIVQVYILNRPY